MLHPTARPGFPSHPHVHQQQQQQGFASQQWQSQPLFAVDLYASASHAGPAEVDLFDSFNSENYTSSSDLAASSLFSVLQVDWANDEGDFHQQQQVKQRYNNKSHPLESPSSFISRAYRLQHAHAARMSAVAAAKQRARSSAMQQQNKPLYDDDDDNDSPKLGGGEGEEFDELIETNLQERLLVAQRVQEEATATGLFPCPYCSKEYNGKHARSIWRRHLQDKHGIPLSQQPRRTRWDGDANRPKNAEERRQRMLESKRRWARKKRMSEKQRRETSPWNDDEGGTAPPEDQEASSSARASSQINMYDFPLASLVNGQRSSAGAYTNFAAPTPPSIRRYLGASAAASSSASSSSTASSSVVSPRRAPLGLIDANMSVAHAVLPHAVSPVRSGLYPPSSLSGGGSFNEAGAPLVHGPPAATAQRPQSISHIAVTASGLRGAYPTSLVAIQPERQAVTQQQQLNDRSMQARTPVHCYAQLYPTPPALGDAERMGGAGLVGARSMAMERISSGGASSSSSSCSSGGAREFRLMSGSGQGSAAMSLLSPPSSIMNESSPCAPYVAAAQQQQQQVAGMPFHSTPRSARLPQRLGAASSQSENPFSLDKHKISPCAGEKSHAGLHVVGAAALLRSTSDGNGGTVEDPFSLDRHKISPEIIQTGRKRERSPAPLHLSASPVRKRLLPPLVGTPLRDLHDEGTLLELMLLGESGRKAGTRTGARATPSATEARERERDADVGNDSGISLTPFGKLRSGVGVSATAALRGTTATAGVGAGALTRPTPMPTRKRRETDQFSSPQHLDLTASLGLAPHSVRRAGVGGSATPGFGSGFAFGGGATPLGATPFAAKLGGAAWPDSTFNPLRYTRTINDRAAEPDDEDDDEDGIEGEQDARFENETPSRAGATLRRGATLSLGAISTPARKTVPPRLRPLNFGLGSSSSGSGSGRGVATGEQPRSIGTTTTTALRRFSSDPSDVSLSDDDDEEEEEVVGQEASSASSLVHHKRGYGTRSRTISYTGSPLKPTDPHARTLLAASPSKASRRVA